MPIYKYKCNKCKAEFEVIVIDKSEEIKCDKCKSVDLKKMIVSLNTRSNRRSWG
jgi:putative FmdB family regulatory protein